MLDLDVNFWRFVAFGAGFGVVVCAYRWVAIMGRAWRYWVTIPTQARETYRQIYDLLHTIRPGEPYPEWYCRYVAFREVAFIETPRNKARLFTNLLRRLFA